MRLRVRYHRPSELVDDHEQQLARGGMLVRVEPDEGVQQFDPVTLTLQSDDGEATVEGQVVQAFPGVGIAVTFTNGNVFDALVAAARARGAVDGAAAEHGLAIESPAQTEPEAPAGPIKGPAFAANEKMGMALRGDRDARATILRENNPTLHVYVLRNPGIQLDEITALAKSRTVTPELLKLIAERREWHRPDIAIALVRNPKTSVGIAIRMLDHISISDLRTLAKDTHTRAPVQTAARKKLLGAK